ncbi:MAG: apolipoprotein N-acyltransferase [Planctomycetota bacterium]
MPVVGRAARFGFSSRRREAVAQHVGAFVTTGLLLMLAFPRPGWGVLAYAALVPAGVAAARTRTWGRLFWTSAVVFALWWAWMLRWLSPVSLAAPPGLGVWLGLNTALGVLAAGVLFQKLRWPMAVALPLGWVGIEAVRSVWPAGGLSWFTLAHSQAVWAEGDVGRVVQAADLLGQHTVGLVVAAVNGALVDLLLRRKRARVSAVGAGLLFVAAWGYGQWRVSQWEGVTTDGPTVAVVQTNVVPDNKVRRTPEQLVEDFRGLVELHTKAADTEPTLIVWPETVVPYAINDAARATYEDGTVANLLAESALALVAREGVTTLAGASTATDGPGEPERFNSAHFIGPDGRFAAEPYHKQHRVPMGEYVPGPGFVESLLERLQVWPGYSLTPGEGPVIYTLPGGHRVATPICYEDAVAGVCREMVHGPEGKRIDALINLTNDGWYPGLGMRRQHAALASLRCIENRVPMARSVNTGLSTFIDSVGRSHAQLPAYTAGTLTRTMRTDGRTTLYGAIGGWPWALFVLFGAGATVYAAVFGRPLAKHRIG